MHRHRQKDRLLASPLCQVDLFLGGHTGLQPSLRMQEMRAVTEGSLDLHCSMAPVPHKSTNVAVVFYKGHWDGKHGQTVGPIAVPSRTIFLGMPTGLQPRSRAQNANSDAESSGVSHDSMV